MKCSRCGKSQRSDAILCGACGAPLMRDESVEPAPPKRYRPAPQEKWTPGSAEDIDEDLKAPGYTVFSPFGRLNRLKYLYFILIYYVAIMLMTAGLALSVGGFSITSVPATPSGPALILSLVSLPVSFMLMALCIITQIKRFHDIDEPGWHWFLTLIPFYNIYVGLKILFKDTVAGSDQYGERERTSWYWQLPLTLLPLPVAVAVVGGFLFAGNLPGLAAAAKAQAQPQHYYNEEHRVSIDFPAGWTVYDLPGFVKIAGSPGGTQAMFLSVTPTEDPDFDTYGMEKLDSIVAAFNDPAHFADYFEFDSTLVSNLSCTTKDINGVLFLQIDFHYPVDVKPRRVIHLFTSRDGQRYTVQLYLPPDASDDVVSALMKSAESLRIGEAAE